MKPTLFILIYCLLLSCTSSPSVMSKHLEAADSVVINIQPQAAGDTAVMNFSTKDKNALQKLSGYLDGKAADAASCAYNGNITFYRMHQPMQAVNFNYNNAACRHFSYTYNGQARKVQLNNEAAAFFNALATGSDSY